MESQSVGDAEQISLSLSQSYTQGFDALRALLVLRTHIKTWLGRGSSSKPSCAVVGLILFITGGSLRASVPCGPFCRNPTLVPWYMGCPAWQLVSVKAKERKLSLMEK